MLETELTLEGFEKPKDPIGNRTCDLQACSAVINQLRHRVPNGQASNYMNSSTDCCVLLIIMMLKPIQLFTAYLTYYYGQLDKHFMCNYITYFVTLTLKQ
jgi:hypothetical protein